MVKRSLTRKKAIPDLKLIYLTVGLVIFGLAIINIAVNLIWLNPFSEKLKDEAIAQEFTRAKMIAEDIENSIAGKIEKISDLSGDIAGEENYQFFIDRFLKENLSAREISLISLDGKEQERYSREEYFNEKEKRDFSFLRGFEEAVEGKTFVSGVNFTNKAEPYIEIMAPIRRSGVEKIKGVLRVVLCLKCVWSKPLEEMAGRDSRALVVDNKGMLIASQELLGAFKKINLLSLPPTKYVLLGKSFKGSKYKNEKGEVVVGVGFPIKKLGWGVLVEEDVSRIEGPSGEVRAFAFVFLIAGLVVIGLLLLLILIINKADKKLVAQGVNLEKKTKELEESKSVLEIRVRARTKELQELAESMEEKAEEKTKELKRRLSELEKFQRLTVGRELKMLELKKEIKELKNKLKKKEGSKKN